MDDATKLLVERGVKLTRLLVQNRYLPVEMDKQILFLYAALRGYLDWMPENLVSVYESEFFRYYIRSPYFWPLSNELRVKNNELEEKCTHFLTWHFMAGFIKFAIKYYNYN